MVLLLSALVFGSHCRRGKKKGQHLERATPATNMRFLAPPHSPRRVKQAPPPTQPISPPVQQVLPLEEPRQDLQPTPAQPQPTEQKQVDERRQVTPDAQAPRDLLVDATEPTPICARVQGRRQLHGNLLRDGRLAGEGREAGVERLERTPPLKRDGHGCWLVVVEPREAPGAAGHDVAGGNLRDGGKIL